MMGKLELVLKKNNYLKSRNLTSCTPDELAAASGVSGKYIRKYLREDSRAFNAMQDASRRWTIYGSMDACRAVPAENPAVSTTATTALLQECKSDGAHYKVGFEPWIGENPQVLILGSLPGDISIKEQTYYANKNNCFWRIMRTLFNDDADVDNKTLITSNGIALWDSAHAGERKGSLDSAFVNDTIVPNDITSVLREYPTIKTIIFNGVRAETIFEQYHKNVACNKIRLISTSSAAARTFDYKLECWSILKKLVQ